MDRKPWGPLIPTQDGRYVQLYEDGSSTTYDQYLNVVNDDSSPNPMRAALAASGRERDAAQDAISNRVSSENTRRWDITNGQAQQGIDQRADEIARTYKVNMMNARTNQDQQRATAQYQQETAQLARDRLGFDRETQQQEFGLKQQYFGLDQQKFGLSQANLGYDLAKTEAAYKQNPNDYFLEQDWARGVRGNPQTSTFLSALQNNTRMAGFNDRGQVAQSADMNGLYNKLGGGADGSGATNDDQRVANYQAQIGNIGAKGAHQLGAGSLEQLTPTEMSLFTAGLKNAGYDSDTFLSQYRRSRIGQGAGSGYKAA